MPTLFDQVEPSLDNPPQQFKSTVQNGTISKPSWETRRGKRKQHCSTYGITRGNFGDIRFDIFIRIMVINNVNNKWIENWFVDNTNY